MKLPTPLAALYKSPGSLVLRNRLAHRANWCSCCFFSRPSSGNHTVVHHASRNAILFGNFGPRRFAVSHVDNGSISCLRFFGSPSAVFWCIAKRIVFALNRQVISIPRRFGPFVETFKREPFVANSYSFASVVFVILVSAASKHVAPTVVNSRPLHAMCRGSFYERFGAFAPAGCTFPATQVTPDNNALCSARATAAPQSRALYRVAGFLKNNPFAKRLACHVNEFRVLHGVSSARLV